MPFQVKKQGLLPSAYGAVNAGLVIHHSAGGPSVMSMTAKISTCFKRGGPVNQAVVVVVVPNGIGVLIRIHIIIVVVTVVQQIVILIQRVFLIVAFNRDQIGIVAVLIVVIPLVVFHRIVVLRLIVAVAAGCFSPIAAGVTPCGSSSPSGVTV